MAKKNDKKKEKSGIVLSWLSASRPPTLLISLASVAMGWGAASLTILGRKVPWWMVLFAALTAVLLQLGANYINDYGDGKRGTDAHRVKKGARVAARLTASGKVKPWAVLLVGLIALFLGAVSGTTVVVLTGTYPLLAVGALAIAGAYFYTAGPFPYAYYGLGELLVFVLFGPVAVAGTVFLFVGFFTEMSLLVGVVMGCWAAAILLINNLRDYPRDKESGKRTLVVLIGPLAGRIICLLLVAVPYIVTGVLTVVLNGLGYVFLTLLSGAPLMIILATARSAKEFAVAFRLALFTLLTFAFFFPLGLYL